MNEKQIIATWNMVIIPHIKYQLQAIFLVKPECEFIIERINGLVKRRADLAIKLLMWLYMRKKIWLKDDIQVIRLTDWEFK